MVAALPPPLLVLPPLSSFATDRAAAEEASEEEEESPPIISARERSSSVTAPLSSATASDLPSRDTDSDEISSSHMPTTTEAEAEEAPPPPLLLLPLLLFEHIFLVSTRCTRIPEPTYRTCSPCQARAATGSPKREQAAATLLLQLLALEVEVGADEEEAQHRRSCRSKAQSSPPLARRRGPNATLRTLSPCGAAR